MKTLVTVPAPKYLLNKKAYLMAKERNEKRDSRTAECERRANKRLNASLPLMLPTGKAYTENISAGGIYFELETSIAEQYPVGEKIPVWVHASYGSNANVSQQLWLFVNAIVVRKEKARCETQSDRWGVGLMFSGKLDSMLCTVNGFY